MREYLKLLKFLKPHKTTFILASICMGFSALFNGVSLAMMVPLADKVLTNKQIVIPTKLPAFVNHFIQLLNNMPPASLLKWMALAILVLFFLKGVFAFFQGYLMSDIGQKVVRDIKSNLYAKMQSLSLDYFTHKRGGELISRITNDVKLVENAVSYGSTDLVYQTLQVIIFTCLVFFLNPKLAFIVIILVPFMAFPIVKVGKMLRKLSKKSQEKMADTNSLLYETIIGTRIVKAFNMEDYEIKKFNQVNQDYYKISMKSIKRTLLLSPATEFMGCIAGVLVLLWAGNDVINGKISFGVFGLSMGSLLSLVSPFKKLSQVNSLNQQAMAASARIHEVLESSPTVVEKINPQAITGFNKNILFEDVYFKYEDKEILRGINLEVKKGQMLAVVGPSGSGKSTLVDLIPRFYDPKQGKILIDGQDIRNVSLKSLRNLIGIVTQETILFNDTVRANISYGSGTATQKDVEYAATQAHIHDFIKNLPLGYDTFIGDRGMKLSGGERQRMAIARALLKNPPILILDEATSQLDTGSERIVQDALNKLILGRTVFVVAHRLSTVRSASKIIVVDKGEIVESGTHDELINREGVYKKLCQLQEIQNK